MYGDKITQFQGIVTGKCQYITGCDQVLVAPPVSGEGGHKEGRWFDVDRLDVLEVKKITIESVSHPSRPGACESAPIK